MITAWRICKAKLATTAFNGHGAADYPGRWNALGVRAVYVAENRSLAALEVLANADDRSLLSAGAWSIIPVQFEPALILIPVKLPPDWRQVPAPSSTRAFGSGWVNSRATPVLRVPSVVTLGEFNYILNPLNPDFSKLNIGDPKPFRFDGRFT